MYDTFQNIVTREKLLIASGLGTSLCTKPVAGVTAVASLVVTLFVRVYYHLNPLPTIGNSLEKQKSLYEVLMPSIKPPYKFL